MDKVVLSYGRDGEELTSSGSISITPQEGEGGAYAKILFTTLPFRKMVGQLAEVLRAHQVDSVELRRTDNPQLIPYLLDQETVDLIRSDPALAVESMTFQQSPSTGEVRARQRREVIVVPPLPAGMATLVDAFGPSLYFRVRGHELECPGCGFWGVYANPRMLADPDRASSNLKAVFVCPKKCHQRFFVNCQKTWGWVLVEDLLKLPLDRFYFPRAWNEDAPWITKDALSEKYVSYQKEVVNVERN